MIKQNCRPTQIFVSLKIIRRSLAKVIPGIQSDKNFNELKLSRLIKNISKDLQKIRLSKRFKNLG